jgi:hypothetical protein
VKRAQTRGLSAIRIAITASVILGVINIILVGATYQRQSASRELAAEKNALVENISSLKKINQEELDELQKELDLIRSDVAELEASFPELGAPFAIYQRAQELSHESQMDLLSIVSQSTDLHDTYTGTVEEKQYSLDLAGAMEDCISFIGKLEAAGRDTLSMKSVNLLPLEYSCSIEVSLLGYSTPAGE